MADKKQAPIEQYHGFRISARYRQVTIYHFSVATGELMSETRIVPKPEHSRLERYGIICLALRKAFKSVPVYVKAGYEK